MVINFTSSTAARSTSPTAGQVPMETLRGPGTSPMTVRFRSRAKVKHTPDPDYAEYADRIDWLFASLAG